MVSEIHIFDTSDIKSSVTESILLVVGFLFFFNNYNAVFDLLKKTECFVQNAKI